MRPIALIRGRYLRAFVDVLEGAGVQTAPLLERHEIPDAAVTDPDALHPAHQLWAFAADAARHTGMVDLGVRAARVRFDHYGEFGSRVARSATLGEALETFCSETNTEYSRAAFRVAHNGRTAWFRRERLDGTPEERLQIELFFVEMMLETIRLAAGADWRPHEIQLQSGESPGLRDVDPLYCAEVRFGCPVTAVPIPRSLLSAPLSPHDSRGHRPRVPAAPRARPPLATDFVGSLRQLLGTYLPEGPPRIEVAAAAARCSVRTLQRRLQGAGLSYSRIVEEVRLGTAAQKLREAGPKLIDIALDAGYSDQANFTRAFRRWAGVPPSQFRRLSNQVAVASH